MRFSDSSNFKWLSTTSSKICAAKRSDAATPTTTIPVDEKRNPFAQKHTNINTNARFITGTQFCKSLLYWKRRFANAYDGANIALANIAAIGRQQQIANGANDSRLAIKDSQRRILEDDK